MFISYAHDSAAHKDEVRALAELLSHCGVRVTFDQWAEDTRKDWSAWFVRQVRESDFIVVVASPKYGVAGDGIGPAGDHHGVQSESAVLRDLLHSDRDEWLRKLIPVILPGHDHSELPGFLQPNVATVYEVDEFTPAGADLLLRVLTRQPARVPPELGDIPALPPHPPVDTSRTRRGNPAPQGGGVATGQIVQDVVARRNAIVNIGSGSVDKSRKFRIILPFGMIFHSTTTQIIAVTVVAAGAVGGGAAAIAAASSSSDSTAGTVAWHGLLDMDSSQAADLDQDPPLVLDVLGNMQPDPGKAPPTWHADIGFTDFFSNATTSATIGTWTRPTPPTREECVQDIVDHRSSNQAGGSRANVVAGDQFCVSTNVGAYAFLKVTKASPGHFEFDTTVFAKG